MVAAVTYAITSAQYYKTDSGVVDLIVPTPSAGVYPFNDNSSTINIEIVPQNTISSTAGKLAVGSYGLSANVLSGSSQNFSNNIEVVGNHTVAKQSLTVSASNVSKQYDSTTSMEGVSLSLATLETGDIVTVNGTGGFSSPNAGTGLDYTISGLNLTGADVSNYYLSAGASFSGNDGVITSKTLTVTGIVAVNKIYDGTASSTVNTDSIIYQGLIDGDDAYLDTTIGVFNDANVGTNKTVTLTNNYAGTDLTNYTVVNQATTTASITAKPITIIPTSGLSKTYGTVDPVLSYTISPTALPDGTTITLGGLLSRTQGDTAGTYSITIGTVSDTNYDIILSPETFEITNKTITVSGITASDKVYDGTTEATLDTSGITFTGLEAGETITATVTGTFDSKNIGASKTVSLTTSYSGSTVDNYTIVDQSSTTASITARTVSVTGKTDINKTFDDTTNLPVGETGYGVLTGVLPGEDVSLIGAAVYNAATSGSRIIEIGTTALSGADKDNYILNWTNGSGTIAKKTLTVTANNDAKFVTEGDASGYNGVSYTGFEGDDDVNSAITTLASVSRSNSGTNTAGSYPGTLVPSGVVATNYDISYVNGDYTIIPADKLLLKVTNQTTTYGTAVTYAITSAQYYKTDSGVVDLIVPTPSAGVYPFNDNSSTINIEIVPQNTISSTAGKLAVGSYGLSANVLSGSSQNFSNNIEVVGNHTVAKQSLTASASNVSKQYDSTTSMEGVSLSLATLETGDIVTVNGTGGFSSPNAGTGLDYTISGINSYRSGC
jgi:hypothetical protein